jgi:hypothetical protein
VGKTADDEIYHLYLYWPYCYGFHLLTGRYSICLLVSRTLQKFTGELILMNTSPQAAYENLQLLEQGNPEQSADYRQLAQDVLADPEVSLTLRQAIADQLSEANHSLAIKSANEDGSY